MSILTGPHYSSNCTPVILLACSSPPPPQVLSRGSRPAEPREELLWWVGTTPGCLPQRARAEGSSSRWEEQTRSGCEDEKTRSKKAGFPLRLILRNMQRTDGRTAQCQLSRCLTSAHDAARDGIRRSSPCRAKVSSILTDC